MKNLNEKSYNAVLQEANDFFQAQGMSIVGDGYKEIATNPHLFESYVETLTQGASANDAANMAQLMVNSNQALLRESSMTGIQPIASLSMPVIRKLWPKVALKDAVASEVAKTPRFVIAYTAPYMVKGDKKVMIPRGLRDPLHDGLTKDMHDALKKEFTAPKAVVLTAGSAQVVDWKNDPHVKIADTPSAIKVQPLDELRVVAYRILATKSSSDAAEAGKVYVDATGEVDTTAVGSNFADTVYEVESIKIGKRLGVYDNGNYAFGNGAQLLVQFDGKNDKATVAAIGEGALVVLTAGVSSEFNEESWDVGFDILRQDVDIPTGQHLNAPLPIEALQDMMALYQIDGTKEVVDLMTNVFAQKLDLEILDFLKKSYANQQNNEAYSDGTYGVAEDFTLMFDCMPAAGFAGSPKAWREELKPLIDHLAEKIKVNTYLNNGSFTIVANPLDVALLANVDWQFRGGQGGNVDGVAVDYSVGTYVGANAYRVISSTNVPRGQMFIVFLPSGDTQMTYKYYAYSFSTEMGYTDPNRSRVPSIMMTKRHTLHGFMDAIGCIMILHNDGKSYFRYSDDWNEIKNMDEA